MNLGIILPLVIYLVFIFGAALFAYVKRSKGDFLTEYYVGNRSMTGFVLAMTTASTYASASSFVGGPGAAYKYGLGWVLLAMIQVPAVWLALGALGKKFALLSRETNALTINDLFLYRYKNKYLVWISSLALLLAFFAAMVVQFIGGARLLETTIGIPYTHACLNSWYLYIYWWLPSGRINGYDSRYGNDFGDNRAISRGGLPSRWCRKCGQ